MREPHITEPGLRAAAPSEQQIPKPGPTPTAVSEPFWAAAAEGRLIVQQCSRCGHAQLYPRLVCSVCWAEDLAWITASGRGTVWTFTVAHKPGHPAWQADAPYAISIVELAEGPRLVANIVGCPPDVVHVGQQVSVCFEPRGPYTVVQFVPDPDPGSGSISASERPD